MIIDITLFKSNKIPVKQRNIYISLSYSKREHKLPEKFQGLNGREIIKKVRKENEITKS